MYKNYIFLDYDGVVVNSEKKVKDLIKISNPKTQDEWKVFFDNINWKKVFEESTSINNSVEIIKELENMKKNLVILTKIHTLKEAQEKVYDIRERRKIKLPIMLVPPHVNKYQIYIPSNNETLIDDSQKNIDFWVSNNGNGILFDEDCKAETKNKVKSLEFLLKEEC